MRKIIYVKNQINLLTQLKWPRICYVKLNVYKRITLRDYYLNHYYIWLPITTRVVN